MFITSKNVKELSWMSHNVFFAVFCKIGALERNAYLFHVKLIFVVIFGESFKLDFRA